MNMASLGGNWVDLVILVVILYFLTEAFRVGFWAMLTDFLYLLFAIIVSFVGYRYAADLFRSNFSISHSFSNALGFLLTAVLSGVFFSFFFSFLIHKIPEKYWKGRWNYFLAILPAIGESLIIVAFALTLAIGLPISPKIKSQISDSKIGGIIVRNTSGFEARLDDIFGRAIKDSLSYLTVNPGSREIIPLTFGEQKLLLDETSEIAMFDLVNKARANQRLLQLERSEELVKISRAYAREMWEKKYFGHYSPEGESVGNRLDNAEINYIYAGENLAMAPTVSLAQAGLINSEGHRANILDAKFKKAGIGVVDNGVYGKIFVQVFTD